MAATAVTPAKRQHDGVDGVAETLTVTNRVPSISHIVLGGGPLGCLFEDTPHQQASETVAAAVAAGVDTFDTAPWYGAGLSEERLGEFLDGHSAVKVWTKCGRIVKPRAEADEKTERVELHYIGHFFTDAYHANIPVGLYTAEGIRQSFQQSCARLRRTKLDCLRLHDGEDEDRFREATEGGGIKSMVELREQGLVGEIGLAMNSSSFALRYLRHFPRGTFDSLMLAGCWNLLDQDGLEVLRECQSLGLRVVNVGIFASGVLWGSNFYKYKEVSDEVRERVRRWRELAEGEGLTLPHVALAFALLPSVVERVAVGCNSPGQVKDNLALCGRPVPAALWSRAKQEGLLAPDVPVP